MRYQFGDCEFDLARDALRREGEVINVTPQVLRVLRYLLAHRDRVVLREELLEACWPESYVSDEALSSCLRRVRRAIGQNQTGPELIETLHRRGYQFVGEVQEVEERAEPDTQPVPSGEPPALASEPSAANAPLILVVEDDPASGELLAQQLQGQGYATRSVRHGQEVLAAVAAERPDLIVLEVKLPGLDGFAVCRQLKGQEATRAIPIMLLTALDSPEDRRRGLEAGADAFLTKPVRVQALLAHLDALLRPTSTGDAPLVEPPLALDTASAPHTETESPANEAPPGLPRESAAMAERRQLSVLSCTLADAARLSSYLDPEDHYDLMQRLQALCEELVAPYAGCLAQPVDEGVVVYFGYPQAHEDDARRAVHSGLALVEAVRHGALAAWAVPGTPVAVGVGIATGMMIVGAGHTPDSPPSLGVGSASSLARHLGALATPGTVVISETTMVVVSGYFECKRLEEIELAGAVSGSVYEVHGESALQTRLEVEAAQGLTPFVGREAEVALFADRWTSVQEGLGQVVLVQGEAGIGKSRLIQVVKEQVVGEWSETWECRCSPYHQNTAFYPLIELVQRALHVEAVTSPEERVEHLEAWLSTYGLALGEAVPLLASLLSLPLPAGRDAPLPLTPERQRARTLDTLLSLLFAHAAVSPLVFVVEDIHWADPSTLEFLQLLVEQVASVPLLVVVSCRPGFAAPWGPRAERTPVMLQRLSRERTAEMIRQVASGKALPAAVLAQIVEKTDGSPLFIEELTRMVLESGQLVEAAGQYRLQGELPELAIPVTLQESLTARLDRLGRAKELAQWGAVLGREFSHALLAAVTPYEASAVQSGLAQLVESGLVFQRGLVPQTRYRFKHALVQEAAYQTLRRRTRRTYHQRVAQVLSAHFPEVAETEPEVVAYHYTEAGEADTAVRYWQRAGQRALERSANPEAIAHVRQGLALLATQPETRERRQQELDLQVALGSALIATQGSAAADVERTYARARELCQQVEDVPQLLRVLRGLILHDIEEGKLQTALQFAEQLLELVETQSDPAVRMLAHHMMGMTLFYCGEQAAAYAHHTQALAIDTPRDNQALAVRYGVDLGVITQSFLAWESWYLGYPDQAMQHNQAARALAQALAHPYSLNLALFWSAFLHQWRHEAPETLDQVETVTALATEQGFALQASRGTVVYGWALGMTGQPEAGIAKLYEGLDDYLTTGGKVLRLYILALLAEVYGASGDPEAGLQALSEALDDLTHIETHFYEAELYRLKGALLLQQAVPDASQAKTCFHRALEVARRQAAKSWELRAATGLARLWQSQGRRQAAYDLLAPVYGWFTEGFDTADLQEAKALLEVLGR